MGANTTVFALQPLLLVAAVLVPLAMVRGTATRAALGLSGLIAALSVFGVLLQVVPTWSQHSGEILAVIVPVHVAIAATMWRMRRAGDVRSSSGRGAL
jgi:protein-S-isoprenylcysteine O-methyltransferase Ste14